MIKITLLIWIVSLSSSYAQYVSFNKESNGTNAIVIPAGERWKIISYMIPGGYYVDVYTSTNSQRLIGRIPASDGIIYGGEGSSVRTTGIIIIGPAAIQVPSYLQEYYFAIEKKNSVEGVNLQSSTSVVIPTSTAGDVDVKLEQSADNVTWTECLPGTYNSSTVKRFFRLRAVEK